MDKGHHYQQEIQLTLTSCPREGSARSAPGRSESHRRHLSTPSCTTCGQTGGWSPVAAAIAPGAIPVHTSAQRLRSVTMASNIMYSRPINGMSLEALFAHRDALAAELAAHQAEPGGCAQCVKNRYGRRIAQVQRRIDKLA